MNTCVHNLSWSHIRRILSVADPNARLWYLKTADKDMWSFRALDRNISTQYYERRLAAQREQSALPVDMVNNEIEQQKRFFMEQHGSHNVL